MDGVIKTVVVEPGIIFEYLKLQQKRGIIRPDVILVVQITSEGTLSGIEEGKAAT
ncbi:hypothetical protein K2Q16_03670 [Patescibacteria group bacterium]|nr:hypothetical protein [Patescibacteria group bacterium]